MFWCRVIVPAALIMFTASAVRAENEELLRTIQSAHNLTPEQMTALQKVFASSTFIGQGNPGPTKHPVTKEECQAKLKQLGKDYNTPDDEKACGAKNMALMDDGQKKVCIDRLEFPNIACEYPVVWVRAKEAVEICEAMGKRLCDAHEWEGGCAGELTPPEYNYDSVKGLNGADAFRKLRAQHNNVHDKRQVWAYGTPRKTGVCAMNSTKNDGCNGGDWKRCGSNTYPAGFFPECSSKYGVTDQHGNAAEHMNLPTNPEESADHPSRKYGHTEMKGSWFIWDKFQAHADHCRWRAPYWHGSRVLSDDSHHNYHLGFRCCKTVK